MDTTTAADPRVAHAVVAVLLGGTSSEREVSLVSGEALLGALQRNDDGAGPREVRRVEIEPDGRWRVGEESYAPLAALAALSDVDVYFLGLHGGEGEGGVLQGMLRAAGKRFTGADVAASSLCLDKTNSRLVVEAHGVRTARAVALTREGYAELTDVILAELKDWADGWVAKRRHGGSSIGVTVVREFDQLAGAIEQTLSNGDDALIEELVDGVEATVAILGNPEQGLRVFTPVEIRPHDGRFFDYEEKYSESGAVELCPPERLDAEACQQLQESALRAYRALDCEGYARIDFLVPEDGVPVFLEANTLPGFTPRSLFPQAAAEAGMDFRSLCLELLRLAFAPRRFPV